MDRLTTALLTGILVLTGICIISASYGQVVHKIRSTTLNGPDGITIDKDDNIYIANWGKDGKGTTITKIDKYGNESIYLDSLSSPDGVTFDKNGNLFISCFASGEIIKVLPGKTRAVFARGLDHPSDLKFDNDGNLYVSCFGNFDGTKVIKVTPAGTQSVMADSLSVPLGLVFDDKQNLYLSNFGSGIIYKINKQGSKTVYARLPNEPAGYFQYLAFDKDQHLYCPSFGQNCIYTITVAGKISKLRIVNEQETDFRLNGPNSIYIMNGTLYFTEFTTNSIYRLQLE